jgi:acetyl esterase/lipase
LTVVAVVVALAGAGCEDMVDDVPPPPRATGPVIETEQGTATPYGTGARQVWVLRPRAGETTSVVVYLHGYGAYLPFEWHLEWMDHLLERGSTVLFPRYQPGLDDPFILTPFDLADGLRTGFDAIEYDGQPIIAAGFSLGATLALVYAARAREWNVPRPKAVYAVFPVDPILVDIGIDLSTIKDTQVLVLAGDRDDVVGREGPREAFDGLTGLSDTLKKLRTITTTKKLFADHEAPTFVGDPVVRDTFWTPLDALLQKFRSR